MDLPSNDTKGQGSSQTRNQDSTLSTSSLHRSLLPESIQAASTECEEFITNYRLGRISKIRAILTIEQRLTEAAPEDDKLIEQTAASYLTFLDDHDEQIRKVQERSVRPMGNVRWSQETQNVDEQVVDS